MYFCCVEAVQNAVKHAAADVDRPSTCRRRRRADHASSATTASGFDPTRPGGGAGWEHARPDRLGGRWSSCPARAWRRDRRRHRRGPSSSRARRLSARLARALALAGVSVALAVLDTVSWSPPLRLLSTDVGGHPRLAAGQRSRRSAAPCWGRDRRSRPAAPIGWLLTLVGVTTCFSLPASPTATGSSSTAAPAAPPGPVVGWLSRGPRGQLALTCLTLAFLLVPTGSCLSPGGDGSRRAAGSGYLCLLRGCSSIGPHVSSPAGRHPGRRPRSPGSCSRRHPPVLCASLATVACMLLRLHRSRGADAGSSGSWRPAPQPSGGVAGPARRAVAQRRRQSWWSSVPLFLAYVFLLVCITVAVLRYRLYDVEVILSRALVLATASRVRRGRLRGSGGAPGPMPSSDGRRVLAVAARHGRGRARVPAAAAGGVVRFADRLAYGPARRAVRRAGRLQPPDRPEPRPGRRCCRRSRRPPARRSRRSWPWSASTSKPAPTGCAAWPAGPRMTADAGRPTSWSRSPDAVGALGSIEAGVCARGATCGPSSAGCSTTSPSQAALAFRNARLQVELAARVEQLDQRTRELDRPRATGSSAPPTPSARGSSRRSAREVLPAMAHLRPALADCSHAPPAEATIAGFADRATEALESLRELTRGIFRPCSPGRVSAPR